MALLGIKRDSLSYKTTILYVISGLIIISLFNFIIWENQSELIIENQKMVVESKSILMRRLVVNILESDDSTDTMEKYKSLAEKAVDEGMAQTVVYSEGGHILYQWNQELLGDFAENRELILINRSIARFELENKQFLHNTNLERGLIELYLPYQDPKFNNIVVIKFALPLLELTNRKNDVLKICILITIAILLLQLGMAFFLRKLIIVPISKIVRITEAVAGGDLKQRATIAQKDEIGILAGAYNKMMVNLDMMQAEAKGANPLSGLPGNLTIMRKIDDALAQNKQVSVIYGDLDNFKAYNDKYGLNKGDEAILHTRDCFVKAAKQAGDNDTFVGHEGGDDFVIVTSFETWEPICQKIVEYFDEGVPKFYSSQHIEQGYIDAFDRQGNPVKYPLMSISLAVVSNHFRKADDHRLLISWAGEMKKLVKKMEGSSYAIDKRTE